MLVGITCFLKKKSVFLIQKTVFLLKLLDFLQDELLKI